MPKVKCPVCSQDFEWQSGKLYCSVKCRDRARGRRHDARRKDVQSEKAKKWKLDHPTYDRDRMRRIREEYGRNDGPMAQFIIDMANPIVIETDAVMIASDWHGRCHHTGMKRWLFDVAESRGVKTCIVPGDFWDADAYSLWPKENYRSEFPDEVETMHDLLIEMKEVFDHIYFCKGNHEARVIKQNNGNMDMGMLFNLTGVTDGYEVTNDNYITAYLGEEKWMFAHPPHFRKTKLSVARDMAAKYLCNMGVGHGHFCGDGTDNSGKFYTLDLGGIFDPYSIAYLRRVNVTPWVNNGFFYIDESGYERFDFGKERQEKMVCPEYEESQEYSMDS